MIRRDPGTESGHSMVEVLAAIVILTVAILPMVGMFDAALRATGASGDYDAARACANGVLEKARSLPYETVEAGLPDGGCQASGFAYEIEEQSVDASLQETGAEEGLIRLTVTVSWARGDSYEVTGVLSRW